MGHQYSMWLVLVTIYNLPPWTCTDQSNCLLTLLTLGTKSPRKDFDLFMRPLIRDFQELWKGFMTPDILASKPEDAKFPMHATVLLCTHDFLALGTMSCRVTTIYNACVHCETKQVTVRLQNKTGCLGHRVFLPQGHKF